METKTSGEGRVDRLSDEPPDATHQQKPRFLQFSLRQFLLLVAVFGVLLSVIAPRIHRTFQEWRGQEATRRREAAGAELSTAVRTNNIALARHALEAGADPNLILTGGPQDFVSALGTCIKNGQIEIMELLLDFGVDVERIERLPGEAIVVFGSPLFAAIGSNQPPEVRINMARLLVARGADPRREIAGRNAMDVAFHISDAQTGDLLREYGVPYGPREMAAFNRLDELKRVVNENREILKERFRPTWAARPGHGPTLLGIALERGYREMALFLIESGAPLDTVEYLGSTLLHEAARGGDPQLIRLLVARGLAVNASDDYHDTPLRDISGRDKPQAVAALLEAGAHVNRQGMNGYSPLHGAVLGDRIEIVRMLLAAGADPTLPDRKGETPLDVARMRNSEIAELLEQALPAEQASVRK